MKSVHEVCERVSHLITINASYKSEQRKIRDIMDGGRAGLRALAGRNAGSDLDLLDQLPTGNPLLSGLTHLSQKLQAVPDLKVTPPKDTNAARQHAETRELLVEDLDRTCRLEMQMPQVGLWLPGYGIASWVLVERYGPDGRPYPHQELRDPMETHPGDFGVDQQPGEIAYTRNISARQLVRMYPEHMRTIYGTSGPRGAVMLGTSGTPLRSDSSQWSSQSEGVQIAEYYDQDGCWWVVPARNLLLEFVPNPLRGRPQFEVAKRFSFNRLQGQYDQTIGLMAMMARLTVMQAQFIQDNTMTETNVFGEEPVGGYHKGRFAINVFDQGTRVEKPTNNMQYQAFQAVDRLERQLRTTARYPITDDGQSPNSFVTGAGLEELGATMGLEVREYQTVLRSSLESLDSKRLEWIERSYGGQKRTLVGERKGVAYAKEYDPKVAIGGHYRTRRKYGFMAGWDESRKLVSGLQLTASEIISKSNMRENLDGLDESHLRIEEQIRAEKAEAVLMDTLLQMAQSQDVRAIGATIEMLPAGPLKTIFEKHFNPEPEAEEEMLPEEAAMPAEPPGLEEAMSMMAGGGQTSSLARLTAQGNVGGGVQTQGAF